jgi:DNA-directed RNA polymerase subunit L
MSESEVVSVFNSRIYNDEIIKTVATKKIDKKLIIEDFPQINGAEITLTDEDHTSGNLIRKALLADPVVEFAGYRMPHPLENRMIFKIKLKDGVRVKPLNVFINAINRVQVELRLIQNELEAALSGK